ALVAGHLLENEFVRDLHPIDHGVEGDFFVVEGDWSRFGEKELNLVLAIAHVELDVVRRQQHPSLGDQLCGGHEFIADLSGTTTGRAAVLIIPAALPSWQPNPDYGDDIVVFKRI